MYYCYKASLGSSLLVEHSIVKELQFAIPREGKLKREQEQEKIGIIKPNYKFMMLGSYCL
jgi:hypothetical protein